MKTTYLRYKDTPKYVTAISRKLRMKPTPQEEMLWSIISGKKVHELKFRRQFPIGRYIVDFYNHTHRLVIEIDGEIHEATKEYDHNRTAFLNAGGYTIVRFTNWEIETNIDQVIEKIKKYTKESPPAGDLGGVDIVVPPTLR